MIDMILTGAPFAAPASGGQTLANGQLNDAVSAAYAVQDAINGANELSQQAQEFITSLPNPNPVDYWGNLIKDPTLSNIGGFTMTSPSAPSTQVAVTQAIGALFVDSIAMPVIAAAPSYTQNNLGFVWNESLWDITLLSAVEVKLLSDLANGGYGIETSDELTLWQRAREREQLNGESLIQDASRQAAARGMMVPSGVLFKQIQAAQQAAQEKNSSMSRDIAMKRADLYVQNRQFTIGKALEAQEVMLNYVSAYFQRQLDAMKANLEAYQISVQIFDAQIKAYLGQLSGQEAGVRMQVEVIDAKVKTYVAGISAYEAQLRGAIQTTELNLEGYKAQVQAGAVVGDVMYKSDSIVVQAAEARIRQMQQQIQNTIETNKTRLGAMEQAAKLIIEPVNALSSIANAYIGSATSIALGTT